MSAMALEVAVISETSATEKGTEKGTEMAKHVVDIKGLINISEVVWILEAKYKGEWYPTIFCYLTRKESRSAIKGFKTCKFVKYSNKFRVVKYMATHEKWQF